MKHIYITGGAGYVGSSLVPYLLEEGYKVSVIDLFLYGDDVLDTHPNLNLIKGDIRDTVLLENTIKNVDTVIHLACISNDPSFELNPTLGRSINLDAFEPLVRISKNSGVRRFVYASSSSVYGVKTEKNVHEGMSLDPLTDYSIFKAECEDILLSMTTSYFETVVIRPATICGYARRVRLDVVVNLLTNIAYNNRVITIFGGDQLRPNLHIKDMVRAYHAVIEATASIVNGEIFNVGYHNLSVSEIANLVKSNVGDDVILETQPTNDNRSYHIDSTKFNKALTCK